MGSGAAPWRLHQGAGKFSIDRLSPGGAAFMGRGAVVEF